MTFALIGTDVAYHYSNDVLSRVALSLQYFNISIITALHNALYIHINGAVSTGYRCQFTGFLFVRFLLCIFEYRLFY